MSERQIRILNCKQCGWKWVAVVECPIKCPSCQSKKWDVPKEKK